MSASNGNRAAESRELLRRAIVRACAAARGNGLTVELLREYCRTPSGRPEPEDIRGEVEYLVGKGLIEGLAKVLSPEVKAWKITAAGRDFASEEGLDE